MERGGNVSRVLRYPGLNLDESDELRFLKGGAGIKLELDVEGQVSAAVSGT